jgi:porphobilinogen synthase
MQSIRLRRLRSNIAIRDIVSETYIHPKHFILPYFVVEGTDVKEPIKSMPGVYHLSIDNIVKDIEDVEGIRAILLFGISRRKDETGSEAYSKDGIVQRTIKAIKKSHRKDLIIFTDVCLCGYTSHGHCGIVNDIKIDNDDTLDVLAKIALSHAEAGADFVAPSAMMDGQIGAIRESLDKNAFKDIGILAYSAKYASNFYGPFREALNSVPQFGDRKTYQMDYRNSDEALREIKQDIYEGADIVMVKPALAYLDIIYRVKQTFQVPLAAYNVSGEYSMIKMLGNGDKDRERDLALEVLTSIKRAGADLIISYFGKEFIRWLS